MKLGWVLAREGVVSALPTENLPPIARFGQSMAGIVARRRAKSAAQSDNLARAAIRDIDDASLWLNGETAGIDQPFEDRFHFGLGRNGWRGEYRG